LYNIHKTAAYKREPVTHTKWAGSTEQAKRTLRIINHAILLYCPQNAVFASLYHTTY